MFLVGFPLLVVPFALYNMIAFLLPGLSWTSGIVGFGVPSGADCALTPGEILVAIAILLLFGEVLKATRLSRRTIVDHLLSSLLFIGMLAEFLWVGRAATGTFLLLLVVSFVDIGGGVAVAIATAPHSVPVGRAEEVRDGDADGMRQAGAEEIVHAKPEEVPQAAAEQAPVEEAVKARQTEAERVRQAEEAVKARQAEVARARQAEAEKIRQAEADKVGPAEAAKPPVGEAEKMRQAEAEEAQPAHAEKVQQPEA